MASFDIIWPEEDKKEFLETCGQVSRYLNIIISNKFNEHLFIDKNNFQYIFAIIALMH